MSQTYLEQALQFAKNKLSAQETRWLLEYIGGLPYNLLLTGTETQLKQDQYQRFCTLADRIYQGEPFDYVLGFSIFRDRKFIVSPAVLIPRPETETLIDSAQCAITTISAPAILELGTGSGIIAITLALDIPKAQITATDLSMDALHIAQQNAEHHHAGINFLHSRWFDNIGGHYDLIVSNPPYIAEHDPHLDDLRDEPVVALTSGTSGLEAITEIIEQARYHLADGGWLWFEHGYDQAEASQQLLNDAGYHQVQYSIDSFGNPRVSGGRWKTEKK